jgi:hypothetical protein
VSCVSIHLAPTRIAVPNRVVLARPAAYTLERYTALVRGCFADVAKAAFPLIVRP